jgi:hypothetical protein
MFLPAQRGVVGLVDDLLRICGDRGLRLDWHDGSCRIRSLGAAPEETTEVPLPKSVFRAVLARLAALCNDRGPGSISPYGGEGELTIGTDPAMVISVTFTNTPGEQRVQLARIEEDRRSPHRPGIDGWDRVPGGNDHRASVAGRPDM